MRRPPKRNSRTLYWCLLGLPGTLLCCQGTGPAPSQREPALATGPTQPATAVSSIPPPPLASASSSAEPSPAASTEIKAAPVEQHEGLVEMKQGIESALTGGEDTEEPLRALQGLSLEHTQQADVTRLSFQALDGLVRELLPFVLRVGDPAEEAGPERLRGLSAIVDEQGAAKALTEVKAQQPKAAKAIERARRAKAALPKSADHVVRRVAEVQIDNAVHAEYVLGEVAGAIAKKDSEGRLTVALAALRHCCTGLTEAFGPDLRPSCARASIPVLERLARTARQK